MPTTTDDALRDKALDQVREELREEIEFELREELREEIEDEILQEQGEDFQVWIDVRTTKMQRHITAVAASLGELSRSIAKDNFVRSREDILSDIERQQLIAILEAALSELKGIAVDRGRVGHLLGFLNRILRRTVEKEVVGGFSDALGNARDRLGEFYGDLKGAIDQLDLFS